MNQLQIFKNQEFGQVRMMELNGQPFFVGKDVTDILKYQNGSDALAKHVDEEDKGIAKCDTLGGTQNMIVINESGLYSLILSSKLPTAKNFKRWVTSEVLPSIRKNGLYSTNNAPSDNFNQVYKIMRALSSAPRANLPYVARLVELQYPGIFDGISHEYSNNHQECEQSDQSELSGTILKFLDESNVLGMPTNQVYLEYLDFCKVNRLNPTNKIHLSRKIVKILDIQIVDKTVNGEKRRLFVSK